MTEQPASSLTRRKFLGLAVAGATTMVAAQWVTTHIAPCQAEGNDTAESWGMLIDLTRCVGCGSCALACKARNNLPTDSPPTELNSDTFTFVDQRQATTSTGESVTRYVKRQCMHCLDASCVSACPAGAMHKSAEGPVVYNASRCLGCRYCQMACPFDVPAFAWDNGLTPTISKCWLCYEAVSEGGRPACASACPTGALRFGNRSDLLAQAHALIASNPGRYVDHIFGEFEVGGTSMLYVSDVPFDELGFPANLPATPPPAETEKIMGALPYVIGGMTVAMTASAAYTHRPHTEEDDS